MSADLADTFLADMSAALDERLDLMRAVDFARAVTRKGVSAQEIIDLVHRHAILADESAGDNGGVGASPAEGWRQ
jgi:hypothetical protein